MRTWLEGKTILLGSFSKIVAPGFRLGWVCAKPEIMEKISVAKQASDLHSNTLCQMILHHYLTNCDLDDHIAEITAVYKRQRDTMVAAIEKHFPQEVHFTRPAGGMFLWVTLPEQLSALELFEHAIRQSVAFVPGRPFFIDDSGDHNMRLNFSNADENMIEEGIRRLGQIMKTLFADKTCIVQGLEETRNE
jgi:2-aminoadipate transaminase